MSLYIKMPVVESRFDFNTLLAEYGKTKAAMERLEQRAMQIECALSDFAEKALEALDKDEESEATK